MSLAAVPAVGFYWAWNGWMPVPIGPVLLAPPPPPPQGMDEGIRKILCCRLLLLWLLRRGWGHDETQFILVLIWTSITMRQPADVLVREELRRLLHLLMRVWMLEGQQLQALGEELVQLIPPHDEGEEEGDVDRLGRLLRQAIEQKLQQEQEERRAALEPEQQEEDAELEGAPIADEPGQEEEEEEAELEGEDEAEEEQVEDGWEEEPDNDDDNEGDDDDGQPPAKKPRSDFQEALEAEAEA